MDLFSTNTLRGVIESLIMPPSFLVDTFFNNVQTDTSEEIHFDVIDKTRRLAPFVSPVVAGKIVDAAGRKTSTFKPAYIKPKTPWNPSAPLKRVAGEQIGGSLNPMDRLRFLVAQTLSDHQDMIRRRLEVMASEALRAGTVTVTGELYPTQVVNFGRDAALTVVKTTNNKWGDSGIKPLNDLQTWALLVLKKSGANPINVVMDVDAWLKFRDDADVKARLDTTRVTNNAMSMNAVTQEGGVYMGTIDGFNIFVYAGWYLDDSGVEQPILPSGTVIMSSAQLQGVQAYGAIQDEAAGYQAMPMFPKSWVEQDPAVRYVMTTSAPLIVPSRPNASFCATVL